MLIASVCVEFLFSFSVANKFYFTCLNVKIKEQSLVLYFVVINFKEYYLVCLCIFVSIYPSTINCLCCKIPIYMAFEIHLYGKPTGTISIRAPAEHPITLSEACESCAIGYEDPCRWILKK